MEFYGECSVRYVAGDVPEYRKGKSRKVSQRKKYSSLNKSSLGEQGRGTAFQAKE